MAGRAGIKMAIVKVQHHGKELSKPDMSIENGHCSQKE